MFPCQFGVICGRLTANPEWTWFFQHVGVSCFYWKNIIYNPDHILIVEPFCLQERFVKRRQHLVGPNSSTLKVKIVYIKIKFLSLPLSFVDVYYKLF